MIGAGLNARPILLYSILAGLAVMAGLAVTGSGMLMPFLCGSLMVCVLSYFQPALVLAFLVVATLLQEILFVSVEEIATLNQAIGIILFVIAGARVLVEKRVMIPFHPVTIALILLLADMTFSYLIFSVGRQNPLQDINQYVRAFAYFLLCLMVIRKDRDLTYIAGAYLLGGLMIAVSGAFWETFTNPIAYFAKGRAGIHGITGHYVEYAIRCMIPIPMAIYVLLQMKRRAALLQIPLCLSIVVLSMGLLLSGSRGAIIAYAFLGLLIISLSSSSILRKVIYSVSLVSIPFLLPIGDLLGNLLNIVKGNFPLDPSTHLRLNYYRTLIEGWDLGSLIWGRGLENFRDYYSGNLNPPHNMWGQSFFELGFIGLSIQVFIVWQIIRLFRMLYETRRISINVFHLNLLLGIGLSIFVILFWGLYENVGLLNGSKHLFILMGVMIAGARGTGLGRRPS